MWRLLLIGIGILFNISIVNAAEIQALGFLGAEGQFNVDFLSEDNFLGTVDADGNVIGDSTEQQREVTQENLELLFHTFIYHPNFVKFDLGFGLVFTQNKVDDFDTTVDTSVTPPVLVLDHTAREANDKALDLNFRLSFFEKKDYPFSFFYVRKHPPINAVTADAFISENTRYGANFLWNAPIRLKLDVLHQDLQGESSLRVVNDQVDSTTLSAYKSYKNDGHIQLSYAHLIQNSKSGSTLAPLIESKNTLDTVTYDSRFNFGAEREYNFNLIANYRQNRDSFEYDEIIVAPNFDWTHTQKLKSNYRYSYNQNIYADLKNTTHAFDAGIAYTEPDGFSTRFDATAFRTEYTGSSSTILGLKNTSSYFHAFKHATFSATVLVGYNNSDTVTDFTGAGVNANEDLTMPKLGDYKELKRSNIIKGSIDLVDLTTGKNYKKEAYEVLEVGPGKFKVGIIDITVIPEGTEVKATYLINPGQDNRFRRSLTGLNSSLQFFKYFNIYAGINKSDIKILEGTVSNTLVTERTVTSSGGGIDYPLFEDFLLIGAETRREETNEESNDALVEIKTATDSAYMQIYLFRGASLYVSGRHATVNYSGIDNSNDIDKTGYRALLKIQTSRRTNLSLVYDDSKDIGNINETKELTETTLQFEWGYRRILVRASGSSLIDLRGDRLRERKTIQFNLVRTF